MSNLGFINSGNVHLSLAMFTILALMMSFSVRNEHSEHDFVKYYLLDQNKERSI